ncbi:MAG: aminodeoxychorismate lyase [Gammaproteobacteria bacterium]|nr:aminodeoxychorismate lyase [Gammaproteobacteria bacterium]
MRSLINGKADLILSSQDRGLQYGDGLFETLVAENGEVKNWSLHLARLSEGCERLFLPQPNELQLLTEIDHLLSDTGKEIVKIIISRGLGPRGYAFKEVVPTRVINVYPWPELPDKNEKTGIELFICQTRIARQPALAGIKHLNRLENVLARHEWQDQKYAEGLMLDTENNVIEGTMSNLFIVKNNKLQTPDLTQCGVNGVTRQRILNIASEKEITLEVIDLSMKQLEQADEVFVCNSVIGLWPVRKIKEKRFLIAPVYSRATETSANPITRFLQKSLLA